MTGGDDATTTVSHVPAYAITFAGHLIRQRCAWCGYVLIDVDLTRIAVQVPEDGSDPGPYPVWSPDQLVRVTNSGGFRAVEAVELGKDERVPDDCCMTLPPELTLAVAATGEVDP